LTQEALNATSASVEQDRRATAGAVGILVPVTATNMVTFSSPVLGLSFACPAELGDVMVDFSQGRVAGFAWDLRFSRFDALSFHGRSADFSDERGLLESDTLGFAQDAGGKLKWMMPSSAEGIDIEVLEILEAEGRPIVLFRLPPPMGWDDNEPWPEHPAALANLVGDVFPGFIAIPGDPERLPLDTFRAILRTIRVTQPSAPPPTAVPGW